MRFSLIIPTFRAECCLPRLLDAVRRQTALPAETLVMDSSSSDATTACARAAGCRVHVIPREQFDHGRTRNLAASMVDGDLIVFMTQDAQPTDEWCLERLIRPLSEGRAAAAYARQIARPEASPPEAFLRWFNYPQSSQLRTLNDLPSLGIKTFFFSNVTSAVRRNALEAVGGFPDDVIMDEDLLFCAKLLRAGHAVAYQADASVYHSHNYSLAAQFRRYFDIGVFKTQAGDALDGAAFRKTGRRFAFQQIAHLLRTGAWRWVPPTVVATGLKWIGFHLGKHHRYLPNRARCRLSMHANYWALHG